MLHHGSYTTQLYNLKHVLKIILDDDALDILIN